MKGSASTPSSRGFLVVLLGVIVLMGSIYVIIATNIGVRSGFLLSFAGFFGWMFIMGCIWWIYGIGLIGAPATWEVVELNRGDLTVAALPEARDLDGWRELSPADPARGEAQATVDAYLTGEGEFTGVDQYLPVAGFDLGGKPKRSTDGVWDRVTNRISNTLRITHPIHYAVIQVQRVTPESLVLRPGEAPPPKEPDESQPVVSVVMVRDLGHLRRTPAVVTLLSGAIFALSCWMLHDRDRRLTEAREQFASAS